MKIARLNLSHTIFLVLSVAFYSCNKDNDGGPSFNYVVEYEEVANIQALTVKNAILFLGLDIPVEDLEYDVDVYKVSYHTNYKGEQITASGIVAIPDMDRAKGTISFQHGTIASDDQAPSNNLSTNDLIIYATMASAGVIVSIPDYIGFGSSVDIMHPYYDEELTASVIADQLYATSELADALEVSRSNDLYLVGYSQGGYATMAAHKYFEQVGIDNYSLKASFPAAGGYDVKGVRDFFFEQETYDEPYFIAYVAESYRITYDWEEPLTQYFKEPYASRIPNLFGGDLSGSQVNAQLTTVIADLVAEDYLTNTDAETYDKINRAFEENSLTDWTPGIDMYMYHGSADVTVPYQNSINVFNTLNSNAVTFLTIQDGTHSTSFLPYLEDVSKKLIEYIN
ncbi:MAG: alpha/beta hydrolase family protein [Bacteroidota bacterium]